jgi:hypothetical protein
MAQDELYHERLGLYSCAHDRCRSSIRLAHGPAVLRRAAPARHASGNEAAAPFKQTLFGLSSPRDRVDVGRLGTESGLSRAAVYSHRDEVLEVVVDQAPDPATDARAWEGDRTRPPEVLPVEAWGPAYDQDGELDEHAEVAELTGISRRTGWGQVRFIVRRVKPSRRHAKKLTEYEKKVGWRFQLTVTNIPARGIRGVPGSHHAFFLDALQREHAVVEDRVRTEKATGIRNLPFKAYARNQAWLLAANIASDLLAYLQLLGLDQDEELAGAEPETLRATILHIPARLEHHARRRILKIEASWPWAETIVTAWNRLGAIPAPS